MSRPLLIPIGIIGVGLLLGLILLFWPRSHPGQTLLAGIKVASPKASAPGPSISILSPVEDASVRPGVSLAVSVLLKFGESADRPSAVRAVIERQGVAFGSAYLDPELQSDGSWRCWWLAKTPPRVGQYHLRVLCEDWVKPDYFASSRTMVKKITSQVAIQVMVK